jgi:hypothetical protein
MYKKTSISKIFLLQIFAVYCFWHEKPHEALDSDFGTFRGFDKLSHRKCAEVRNSEIIRGFDSAQPDTFEGRLDRCQAERSRSPEVQSPENKIPIILGFFGG